MAKYVCDYATVRNIAQQIQNEAATMNETLASYLSAIDTELAEYKGESKDNFITSNTNQVEVIKGNVEQVQNMANFINAAVNAIEAKDSELATLTI